MDIPSALTKDEEHPGFYSASYPGPSHMMGIIPHERPTHANRSKTNARAWIEQPASSPVEDNSSISLSSLGKLDDPASTIALASKPSSLRPRSIAEFLAGSQDFNPQSEDDAFFDAASYAEHDSSSDATPRAEQTNPFEEIPRAKRGSPFESIRDDEMNRRRFSQPLGSPFKTEPADDTSKKPRRFSIFNPGRSLRAGCPIGQSELAQSTESPGEPGIPYTLDQSVNSPSPRIQDFGEDNDTAPSSVVSLSPGSRTISRQSAAIYGIPPTSGNLRTVSDGSPTKQAGSTKALLPDYDPIASLHSKRASVTEEGHPAASQSQGFQMPDNWFHQGLVDDDAYCTQQEAFEDDALDTCSTHNDMLHSSSPKSSYTLKRPQHTIPKQPRAFKTSEQAPTYVDRELDPFTVQAANSIANIDLEFLARPNLSAEQKDTYLDAAIATAKHIANTTGLPFMILKDHKSDVVVSKKNQAKWLAGASNWKARMLAEAETVKEKHTITELQQSGSLPQTQMRSLSLPTATATQPRVSLLPSTPSSNQRPQTLSKAHEILGLATPPRMAPMASPNRLSPRASPQYQHKPFRSSRSPDMVKLREAACNESQSASAAKEKEDKEDKEEKEEKGEEKGKKKEGEKKEEKKEEKEEEKEETYCCRQIRLFREKRSRENRHWVSKQQEAGDAGPLGLGRCCDEERELWRQLYYETMRTIAKEEEAERQARRRGMSLEREEGGKEGGGAGGRSA